MDNENDYSQYSGNGFSNQVVPPVLMKDGTPLPIIATWLRGQPFNISSAETEIEMIRNKDLAPLPIEVDDPDFLEWTSELGCVPPRKGAS